VEHLANEEFVLIAAEALADHATEIWSVLFHQFTFDGLKPTACGTSELHSGAFHPHGRIDGIEVKVILGTGHPVLGVIAVELVEVHLWKVAEMR
jgi:hypothetical protein